MAVIKMGDGQQQSAPLKGRAEQHIETAAISADSNRKRAKTHTHRKPSTIYNFKQMKGQETWTQRRGKKQSGDKVSYVQSNSKRREILIFELRF